MVSVREPSKKRFGQIDVARVDQMPGQPLGDAEVVINLPQGQDPGVAGEPLEAIRVSVI